MSERKNGQGGHGEARPPARPRSGARPAPAAPAADPTRVQPAASARPAAKAEDAALAPVDNRKKREKKPKGRIKKATVLKVAVLNVFKALFVLMCIGLMIGGIAAVQMVQYVVDATEDDENLLDLENYQMNQTSYMMAFNPDNPNAREEGDYIVYQELVGDEDRTWAPLDQIPQDLINAVVATEDREFFVHHGVNFRRTVAALVNEVIPIPGMRGGASTITQQLVKNITKEAVVVGEDGDVTEGYKRKMREIFRSWGLENRYSKEMIMEAYLNTIGLSERIAGVGAGARRYFDKDVKDLTLAECAVIAGITQYPTRYSPIQNPENALTRRNDVLWFMYQSGYITRQQFDETSKLPLGLAETPDDQSSASSDNIFTYLTDKAYNDVIDDLVAQKGMSRGAAMEYLYNGGLRVYLTGDLNIQAALDDIMTDGYEEGGFFMNEERFPGYVNRMMVSEEILDESGNVVGHQDVLPQVAVCMVNYKGELIATSGGIGEKKSSLSLNRGIGTVKQNAAGEYYVEGTVRQVGSTMKPIAAYAKGLDYGIIHYSKMVLDEGVQSKTPTNPRRNPDTGAIIKDWPENYGITRHTKIPIVSAVAESTNTVAAQVGMWVGPEAMYEFLVDTLQVTSLVYPADLTLGPLVLGSHTYGMSAYELAGAYAMFGGEDTYGVFTSLHSYSRVTDSKGNIVLEPEVTTVQAVSPETGYIMNRLMYNVLRPGSFPGGASPTAGGRLPENELGIDAVGKTGTTSEDNDRWFVGLTPDYVTTVWWGYDVKHKLGNWSAGARTNIPVNTWKALMEATQTEANRKEFPAQPAAIEQARFCTITGDLAGPGCPGGYTGYYDTTEGHMPGVCQGHDEAEMAALAEPPAA